MDDSVKMSRRHAAQSGAAIKVSSESFGRSLSVSLVPLPLPLNVAKVGGRGQLCRGVSVCVRDILQTFDFNFVNMGKASRHQGHSVCEPSLSACY